VPGSLVGELEKRPRRHLLVADAWADRPTWITSDRRLARYVARPVARFLDVEAAGGLLLLAATVAALVWANSPWSASYGSLWHTNVGVDIGSFRLSEDLGHWVNDGLMAVFFFVIGLEIKGELVHGRLSTVREAALPAIGALGGMVVPALLFLAFNLGGAAAHGWAIPMATDIAFAVGVLALLGDRVPGSLKVLLLGLAIADDIGAIIVIAIGYTDRIEAGWLLGALAGLVIVGLMRRARIWYTPAYVGVGVGVWVCTLESGIHATIAGVALGLLTPASPLMPGTEADRVADQLSTDTKVTAGEVRAVGFALRESVSPAERLEHALHPWTSYVVVPVFALANAGIPLSRSAIGDAASSPITAGVVVGLVVGKLVGISAFSWLAVRLGAGRLPDGVAWRHLVGMAALAGIGFTVSLFVSSLAFADPAQQDQAKIGVLAASVLAAIVGSGLLLAARASTRSGTSRLARPRGSRSRRRPPLLPDGSPRGET
jgi:NhaA family Na+:H+ antiporter